MISKSLSLEELDELLQNFGSDSISECAIEITDDRCVVGINKKMYYTVSIFFF